MGKEMRGLSYTIYDSRDHIPIIPHTQDAEKKHRQSQAQLDELVQNMEGL